MSEDISYNAGNGQYLRVIDGHSVIARTHINGQTVYIDYVEAAPALRGSGAAGAFMEDLTAKIAADGHKIYPVCGYAASWYRRHPEHSALLDT